MFANCKHAAVCDPVLGDEGKLYVPQELISVYQQKVIEMRRFFWLWPFSDGVGTEGAGRQLLPLQLRPRRERVAVRRPEPKPRVPDEGPLGDRHHLRPTAAPAPRARDHLARRRRIGT